MALIAHDEITSGRPVGSLKEDIVDAVNMISPTDHPFMVHRKQTRAIQIIHVNPYDALDSSRSTQSQGVTEGQTFIDTDPTPPSRLENYTQIWRKDWGISGTQQAVAHYGMSSPYRYYLRKALKEIGNYMENSLLKGQGTVGATNARRTVKGLVSATNVLSVSKDCTASTMTEDQFNTLCQLAWAEGANIDEVYCGPYMKRATLLSWTTNTRNVEADREILFGNVDVYVGPFGRLRWYMSRDMTETPGTPKTNDIAVIQGDLFRFAKLREENIPLNQNGDRLEGTIIVEGTLECANAKGGVYTTNASHAAFN